MKAAGCHEGVCGEWLLEKVFGVDDSCRVLEILGAVGIGIFLWMKTANYSGGVCGWV